MRELRDCAKAISRPGVAQAGTVFDEEVLIAGSDAAEAWTLSNAEATMAAEITRYVIDITHQPSMSGRANAPG